MLATEMRLFLAKPASYPSHGNRLAAVGTLLVAIDDAECRPRHALLIVSIARMSPKDDVLHESSLVPKMLIFVYLHLSLLLQCGF